MSQRTTNDLDKIMRTLAMPAILAKFCTHLALPTGSGARGLLDATRKPGQDWDLSWQKTSHRTDLAISFKYRVSDLHHEKRSRVLLEVRIGDWANIHSNLASNYRRRLCGNERKPRRGASLLPAGVGCALSQIILLCCGGTHKIW